MSHSETSLAVLVILGFLVIGITAVGNHATSHRVDKFSFRPPYRIDETKTIPGWKLVGKSSRVTSNYIRLTNDVRNANGFMANGEPYTDNSIELSAAIKIHSPEDPGADGMAIWLTEEPIHARGNTFGGPETWNGVVVILDTYDNDGGDPHPFVTVHYNEGNQEFQFADDGASTFVGGCFADYRNAAKTIIHLFIEDDIFNLYVDAKGTGDWKQCMEPARVKMPDEYYFSISAATGGYSDFHDILSFEVSSMEKRSVDIYRPPKHLIPDTDKTTVPEMKKMLQLNNCVLQNTCLNLEVLNDPISELEELSETIGVELVKIQNSVRDTMTQLQTTTNPVAVDISNRRNDIQTLRSALEEKQLTITNFRDSLMKIADDQMQSQKESRDFTRVSTNIASAQRILTQVQRDQKTLGQALDIQISVLQPSSLNVWIILCLIFGTIQLITVSMNFCKKKDKMRHF